MKITTALFFALFFLAAVVYGESNEVNSIRLLQEEGDKAEEPAVGEGAVADGADADADAATGDADADGDLVADGEDGGEGGEDGGEGEGEGEEDSGEEEEGPEGFMFFLPFFLYLFFGMGVQLLLMRTKSGIPYTLILLFAGILIGYLHITASEEARNSMPIHFGISYITNISPELFLTVFLPVLVMSDGMNLNMHLFLKTFGQTVMLAGTGVLFGALMGALVAYYLFDYNWPWTLAALFGSILSATDPVAVVSLLQAVGASPILTMQITGESLLNDGTAIVLFLLFWGMVTDPDAPAMGVIDIVVFSLRMAVLGPIWGMFMGTIFTYCIGLASRKTSEMDAVLQIVFTIAGAYCVFYTSEHLVNSSAVLGTTFCGAVMSSHMWPTIVSREAMEHVWGAIEFVANTLLFMMAGTIFGAAVGDPANAGFIGGWDWAVLFFNFVFMVIIRFAMIIVHYYPLTKMGYPPKVSDAIFMAWGGLRGAVGISLAVFYYQEMKTQYQEDGDIEKLKNGVRFVFLIGGGAACTLLFLGTTSKMLLDALGLIKTPASVEVLQRVMQRRITLQVQMDYAKMMKESSNPPDKKIVSKFVTALRGSTDAVEKPTSDEQYATIREVFLNIVRSEYWDLIEKGEIPEHSTAATHLLASIESAMDDCPTGINDWKYLVESFAEKSCMAQMAPMIEGMCMSSCPCAKKAGNHKMELAHSEVYAYTGFIMAHTTAQTLMEEFFGADSSDHMVVQESEAKVGDAITALDNLKRDFGEQLFAAANTTRMAALLLFKQAAHINELTEKGILTPNQADAFMEQVEEDEEKLLNMDSHIMKQMVPSKTPAPVSDTEMAEKQPLTEEEKVATEA